MVDRGNGNGKNGWRTQPMYTYREVARLARISVSTVRNWLHGYENKRGEVPALFKGHEEDKACSFLQLVEIIVAGRFRKAEHTSFETVRRAYDNARELFHLEYPFAHMELKSIGGHIVHVIRVPGISLQDIDTPEQYTLPDLVQRTITEELDFERELASRWYPLGKEIPIVVDPQISAGLPVIRGRGVTVEAIYKRFKANQEIRFIEKDFGLKQGIVEQAIRFREKVAV